MSANINEQGRQIRLTKKTPKIELLCSKQALLVSQGEKKRAAIPHKKRSSPQFNKRARVRLVWIEFRPTAAVHEIQQLSALVGRLADCTEIASHRNFHRYDQPSTSATPVSLPLLRRTKLYGKSQKTKQKTEKSEKRRTRKRENETVREKRGWRPRRQKLVDRCFWFPRIPFRGSPF